MNALQQLEAWEKWREDLAVEAAAYCPGHAVDEPCPILRAIRNMDVGELSALVREAPALL